MGLDQYAYVKSEGPLRGKEEPFFIWRKHSKLQEWAEQLFIKKTGKPARDLNCAELELDWADIDKLQALLERDALPKSPGGFFYGHQFQDEQADYSGVPVPPVYRPLGGGRGRISFEYKGLAKYA